MKLTNRFRTLLLKEQLKGQNLTKGFIKKIQYARQESNRSNNNIQQAGTHKKNG
jgi:hypothetical protein